MKIHSAKFYQAIQFESKYLSFISVDAAIPGTVGSKIQGLEMEILPNLGVLKISSDKDCTIVSMANVQYAKPMDVMVEEKPKQKKTV
ncbi:MAG: hypothetical protein FMNOHCHN_03726 [Ignavibacteriaceae bacterium]|nr:hypothetical protein [Ignavibacteriaceae bacterium]